jgi:protoheme IX farnesyltransferase
MGRLRFHHFAWGLLGYTLAVVLGGAFVRATLSGDGCGAHWPSCQGALIPAIQHEKTLIEYCHRLSSGLLLPLVIALVVGAFRSTPRGHAARRAATFALVYTLVEGLIGAGLVLYELVGHDRSAARAVVMPAHLVTTFLLIASIALAAWWSNGGAAPRPRGQGALGWALGLGLVVTLLLGVSGAITALGDTLFPAGSLEEVFQKDPAATSHLPASTQLLLSLRVYHPLLAMSAGLYLLLLAGLAQHLRPSPSVQRFSRAMVTLYLTQMGAGLLNLLLLAPVWMQILHLMLAVLLWSSQVLMTAAAVAEGVPHVELSAAGTADVSPPPVARATWRDYLVLTKPRVISLLLFTTLTAMAVADGVNNGPGPGPLLYLAVAIGFTMAAGAANAINMVLERDLDLRMPRTALRPTVTSVVPPRAALQFALALTVGSFALLWGAANLLTAMLALAGLACYVLIYTLLLKRRSWTNIVIGGAAGAFPPLVGWAAVAGDLSALAWCLFGIIFLWTPVHFWALAIMLKEEYAQAGVPMLPVVRGERATVVQIGAYTLLTVAISLLPLWLPARDGAVSLGGFYLTAAALLNALLLARSAQLYRRPQRPQARALFKYSMVYLALLFLAMAVDTRIAGRQPPVVRAEALSDGAASARP